MNAPEKLPLWMPRAGSLAHRLLTFLQANPDEELFASDIAIKFDIDTKSIAPCLVGALASGALAKRKDDRGRAIYALGADQSWRDRVASAAPEGSALAAAAHPYTAGATLTASEISALQIQRGFPFPDRKKARAAAAIAMQEKLRELEPDCRLPIPDGARALCTAAMKIVGLDTGAKLALRPDKGQLYCWRLA
jgi:hypothetical protein